MSRNSKLLLFMVLVVASSAFVCGGRPNVPPNSKLLAVPYVGAYAGFTAAAPVWSWDRFVGCGSDCHETWWINDRLHDYYGTHHSIGWTLPNEYHSSGQIAAVVSELTERSIESNEYCTGPPGTLHSALDAVVADHSNSIYSYNLPVITPYWDHWVLVTGVHWEQLSNGIPQALNFWYHDPLTNNGRDIYITVGTWRNRLVSQGGCYLNVQVLGNFHGPTQQDWEDWDSWGGTYYGDEDPPECSECPPEAAPLMSGGFGRWLKSWLPSWKGNHTTTIRADGLSQVAAGESGQRRRKPRGPGLRQIPILNPTTIQGAVADFVAGIGATGLAKFTGYEFLDLAKSGATISSVERVDSLVDGSHYFILTVSRQGVPAALATVESRGWLGEVRLVETPAEHAQASYLGRPPASLTSLARGSSVRPRLVVSRGPMFRGALDPLWSVQTSKGRVLSDRHGRLHTLQHGSALGLTPLGRDNAVRRP